MKTLVIGGGITGLGVAYASGLPLFEAQKYPGGICASYYMLPGSNERLTTAPLNGNAYRFEYGGGHWIFGIQEAMREFISHHVEITEHQRVSSVFLESHLKIPYPIQYYLHYLKDDNLILKIVSEIEVNAKNSFNNNDNNITMEEWLKRTFGETLYQLFFGPFHQLYTCNLHTNISPQDKYKSPVDIQLVQQGTKAKEENKTLIGYNSTYIYPRHGLNTLAQQLAKDCQIFYNKEVIQVDLKNKELHLADNTNASYDNIISTLPLDVMLSLAGLKVKNEEPPPFISTLVVNIGAFKGEQCPTDHWLYLPSSKSGFHRIGFYSNIETSFLPQQTADQTPRVAMYVERSFLNNDKLSPVEIKKYIGNVIVELQELGFINAVEVVDSTWIKCAYTCLLPNSHWHEAAISLLEENGIFPVGRYARWHFQGIAESLRDGLYTGLCLNPHYAEKKLSAKLIKEISQGIIKHSNLVNFQEEIKYSITYGKLTAEERFYKYIYCQPDQRLQKFLKELLGVDFARLADELEQYGIVSLTESFSGEQLKNMQVEFNQLMSRKQPDNHAHIQFGGSADEEYLQDCQALSKAITDPLIWALGAYVWGRDPQFAFSRAYRIEPTPPKKYRAFQPHHDGHAKEYKVMILLTDVPTDGQRMLYWAGTQKIDWTVHSSRDTLFSDGNVQTLGKPVECIGKAGTIFVFNTNGVHSGTRNETMRRDTLVINITGGKRLYKVPLLHKEIRNNLLPYQAKIFRVNQEKQLEEIENELPSQTSKTEFETFFQKNKEEIVIKAKNTPLMLVQHAYALTKNILPYTTSPFAATLAAETRNYTLSNLPVTEEEQQNLQKKLIENIREDLNRGFDLPLRLYSGTRDRLRDLALCDIRDHRLSNNINLGNFAKKITKNLTKISSLEIVNHYLEWPNKIVEFIELIKKSSKQEIPLLENHRFLMKDLQFCINTADSIALLRTSLIFLLGTVDYLQEIANKYQVNSELLNSLLHDAYHQLAKYYIAYLQTELINNEPLDVDLRDSVIQATSKQKVVTTSLAYSQSHTFMPGPGSVQISSEKSKQTINNNFTRS